MNALICTFFVCVCLQGLEENMSSLVGDCLLAASFLSYMGPFLSHYREELLNNWMTQVRDDTHTHMPTLTHKSHTALLLQVLDLEIAVKPGFSFADFLSCPTTVRDWNIQGLPSDAFSTENGVIVTRGNRWV